MSQYQLTNTSGVTMTDFNDEITAILNSGVVISPDCYYPGL